MVERDAQPKKMKRREGKRGRPLTVSREAMIGMAARQIFERGATKFSMRGLAEEAGVTAMALYHHFDSKDEVIAEAFLWTIRSADPVSPSPDKRAHLVALIQRAIEHLHSFSFTKEMAVSAKATGIITAALYADFIRAAHEYGIPDVDIATGVQAMRRIVIGEALAQKLSDESDGDCFFLEQRLPEELPWSKERTVELLSSSNYRVEDLLESVVHTMMSAIPGRDGVR